MANCASKWITVVHCVAAIKLLLSLYGVLCGNPPSTINYTRYIRLISLLISLDGIVFTVSDMRSALSQTIYSVFMRTFVNTSTTARSHTKIVPATFYIYNQGALLSCTSIVGRSCLHVRTSVPHISWITSPGWIECSEPWLWYVNLVHRAHYVAFWCGMHSVVLLDCWQPLYVS